MSDITKPTPESTAIPLSRDLATYEVAFQHLTKVLVTGYKRIEHPHAENMKPLHIQLAAIGVILIGKTKPRKRLAKFGELLDDYKNQLAGVGYRAFLDENILIVETVEAS